MILCPFIGLKCLKTHKKKGIGYIDSKPSPQRNKKVHLYIKKKVKPLKDLAFFQLVLIEIIQSFNKTIFNKLLIYK